MSASELVSVNDLERCSYFLLESSPGTELYKDSICEAVLGAIGRRLSSGVAFAFNVGHFSREFELWDDAAVAGDLGSLGGVGSWMSSWESSDFRLTPRRRLGGVEGTKGGGPNLLAPLRAALDDPKVQTIHVVAASPPSGDVAKMLKQLGTRRIPIHTTFVTTQHHLDFAALSSYHLLARETGGKFRTAYFSSIGDIVEVLEGANVTGIYPSKDNVFNRLSTEKISDVKDMTVGQLMKSLNLKPALNTRKGEFDDLKVSLRNDEELDLGPYRDQHSFLSLGNPNWNAGGKLGSKTWELLNAARPKMTETDVARLRAMMSRESGKEDGLNSEQMEEIRTMFRRLYSGKDQLKKKAAKSKPYKVGLGGNRIDVPEPASELQQLKVKTYKLEGLGSDSDSSEVEIEVSDAKIEKLARKFMGPETFRRSLLHNRSSSFDETRESRTGHFSRPQSTSVRASRLNSGRRLSTARVISAGGTERKKRAAWKPLGGGGSGGVVASDRNSWMNSTANARVNSEERFYQMRGKKDSATNTAAGTNTASFEIRRPQLTGNRLSRGVGVGPYQVNEPTELVSEQADTIHHLVRQNGELMRTVIGAERAPPASRLNSADARRVETKRARIFSKIHAAPPPRPTRPTVDLKSALNAQIRELSGGGERLRATRHPQVQHFEQRKKSQDQLNYEQMERVQEARGQYTQRNYKAKYDGLVSEVEARNRAPFAQKAAAAEKTIMADPDGNYVLTARDPPPRHVRVPLNIIPSA